MTGSPNPKTILIVDDNETSIRLMTDFLSQNYEVKLAKEGESAVDIAADFPHPDLILLDTRMPDVDGYEVCHRLKQNAVLSDIPIILLSARTETEDKTKGFSLGAADYVTKPIELPVLEARVKTHLKMREQQQLLATLSYTDPITELPNRRKYYEVMEREWKRGARSGQPLSLLMINIDYFKEYKDRYGHGKGNECLQRVAQSISSSIARAGDQLARVGGEEFAVILPDCNSVGTRRVSQKIIEAVVELDIPYQDSEAADCVTLSIGAATDIPSVNGDGMSLFNAADKALSLAKAEGRNRFVLAR